MRVKKVHDDMALSSNHIELRNRKRKKFLFFLLISVILCIATGCTGSKYKKAKQLYDEQKYEQAYQIFKELDDYEDSKHLMKECCYFIGKEYGEGGEYEIAMEWLERAGSDEKVKSAVKKYTIIYARKICEKRQYDEAVSLLEKLPEDSEVIKVINECKYKQIDYFLSNQQYDEAFKVIETLEKTASEEEIIKISTLKEQCYIKKGIYLFEQNKLDEAAEAFLAVNLNAETKGYLIKIAKKYMQKKKYQQAKKICMLIPGEKKAEQIWNKLLLIEKYENYQTKNSKIYSNLNRPVFFSKKKAEEFLNKHIYRTWYEYYSEDAGKKYTIDKYTRQNRAYGIYAVVKVSEIPEWHYIYYYYKDNPKKIYVEAYAEQTMVTERGGLAYMALLPVEQNGFYSEDKMYGDKSTEELRDYFSSLPEVDDEPEDDNTSKQPSASNNDELSDDEIFTIAESFWSQACQKVGKSCEFRNRERVNRVIPYEAVFRIYLEAEHSERFLTIQIQKGYMGEYYFVQAHFS